ncbi:hydroxyacid dehydrogenase [Paenibacillus sp. IB182496]|uniref:Hydroxyacid dehydrogenase n=1 Tax=Paenibacillus sabuli TaxID=2772509 RepID=A0A927BUP9_9BACL|nr:hydroxyacid dehydrogenase [Paenibacillus sabuli]MBD2845995.1 hydroxyacid dehydrogenase [Paenibacillus sabuli]
MTTQAKPKAAVLLSQPKLRRLCSPACRQYLETHFEVHWNERERELSAEELVPFAEDAAYLFTSWGSPRLSESFFKHAAELRAVAHAAGSVKFFLPASVFEAGVRVFSANPRLSLPVSEYCMAVIFAWLRHIPTYNAALHAGGYRVPGLKGRELTGSRVGLISAGATARGLIRMLQPYEVEIRVYDPFLSEAQARQLGVIPSTLEEAMGCTIVSNHAPNLPETAGLIGAEQLARIPDEGIFINSGRAAQVDTAALVAELKSGRIYAACDVFDEEPLPVDSPLRGLANVILTPHVGAATQQADLALLPAVAEDVVRMMRGEPTRFEIAAADFSRLA